MESRAVAQGQREALSLQWGNLSLLPQNHSSQAGKETGGVR